MHYVQEEEKEVKGCSLIGINGRVWVVVVKGGKWMTAQRRGLIAGRSGHTG